MTPEEETLEKIKFFLSCNNESSARRAIEQYGHYRQEQALQLQQGVVMQSVFKVMAGNSELDRFKSREKAEEICEYYKGKGFPNAIVEETVA